MSQPLYESVDPETYLGLAKELASKLEVAAKRTAADRAYYAAFLTSRDLLAKKGYITPYNNSQDHKYVEETLKRSDILGACGNDENRLRRARNIATYDTRGITPDIQRYARPLAWMLRTAEEIINKIRELPQKSGTQTS